MGAITGVTGAENTTVNDTIINTMMDAVKDDSNLVGVSMVTEKVELVFYIF